MIDPRLFVRIVEMEGEFAPRPLPLRNGFRSDRAYRVLGGFSHGNECEHLLVLANDRNELWYVSNRHVRVVELDEGQHAGLFWFDIKELIP